MMSNFIVPATNTITPADSVNLDRCNYVRKLDDALQKPSIGFYFGTKPNDEPAVVWAYANIDDRDAEFLWISDPEYDD